MADRSEESRVLEYVTVTGTGPVTTGLASPNGPVVGMRGFAAISGLAAGDTFDYFIEAIDGFGQRTGTYEEGQGVWIGAGQFNRTQVWRSSNGNAAVNFAAGTKVCGISISGRTWAAVQLAARRWRERVYRAGTLTSNQVVHRVPVDEAVAIPANWANSLATCETAPNAAVTLGIFAGATGATQIGTISFASGATTGTFTSPSGAAQAIAANDILRIVGPSSANGTFAGVSITLVGFRNIEPAALEPIAAYANWKTDLFTGNGSQTAFTLSSDPGSIHNMQVSVAGAVRVAGIDYTLSGTTLTFTTAPANGALVAVRYGIPLPLGTVNSENVRGKLPATDATWRSAHERDQDLPSVLEFGADKTGATDATAAFTKAWAAFPDIYVPPGTYELSGMLEPPIGQRTLRLAAGAILKRDLGTATTPLVWLKYDDCWIIGSGRGSIIRSSKAHPEGLILVGHRNMQTSHANVNRCGVRDVKMSGRVAYGPTSGAPDHLLRAVNPQIGGLASYFHQFENIAFENASYAITLDGWANGITGHTFNFQYIGNPTLPAHRAAILINGAQEVQFSNFFFHYSPGSICVEFRDYDNSATPGGAVHVSQWVIIDGMCEQDPTASGGLGLKAIDSATTGTFNWIRLSDNVGGNDIGTNFSYGNTIFLGGRNLYQMPLRAPGYMATGPVTLPSDRTAVGLFVDTATQRAKLRAIWEGTDWRRQEYEAREHYFYSNGAKTLAVSQNGFGFPSEQVGSVTQSSSKTTGVTLNQLGGDITMAASALAANTTASFQLTNSRIAAGDHLLVSHVSGGTLGAYVVTASTAAGSATIHVRNVNTSSLSEAIVVRFSLLKASLPA